MYKNEKIKKIIENIPLNPGIYLMKNSEGNIMYVGKAKSLRKRVRQYFNRSPKSVRIQKMVSQIENIEYIVTNNELEALVLECNYIKENMPKYNVMLKDDKTYPYVKITVKDKYPRIFITRKKIDDGSMYFGPYTDVRMARDAVNMVKEIFPIKRCNTNFDKSSAKGPCLYYHIGRCLGPCINEVHLEEYKDMINQVVLFFNGNSTEIKKRISEDIDKCIEKLEFEKANKLKQRLDAIEKLSTKQQAANINENNIDVWGYVHKDSMLYMQVFKIREYKLLKHNNIKVECEDELEVPSSVVSIIEQSYNNTREDIPKKIYIRGVKEETIHVLNDYLTNLKGSRVEIKIPKIGDKLKLIETVENNIKININEDDSSNSVVNKLQELLGLNYDLNSLEAYDISNLRNEYIVGTMIRFEDGKLNKNMYRKFKIKSTNIQNDPLCMAEIISRRLNHAEDWPLPDLILLDGGKTQISAVKDLLELRNIDIDIIGMVKNDKHRTRGIINTNGDEIDLTVNKETKKILNFLTFIQDEVHRFTITYHRKLRDRIK